MEGIIKFKVVPPRKLYHSVLAYKSNSKLMPPCVLLVLTHWTKVNVHILMRGDISFIDGLWMSYVRLERLLWRNGLVSILGILGSVFWYVHQHCRFVCKVHKHVPKIKSGIIRLPNLGSKWRKQRQVRWGLEARIVNCSRQGIHFQKCRLMKFRYTQI